MSLECLGFIKNNNVGFKGWAQNNGRILLYCQSKHCWCAAIYWRPIDLRCVSLFVLCRHERALKKCLGHYRDEQRSWHNTAAGMDTHTWNTRYDSWYSCQKPAHSSHQVISLSFSLYLMCMATFELKVPSSSNGERTGFVIDMGVASKKAL